MLGVVAPAAGGAAAAAALALTELVASPVSPVALLGGVGLFFAIVVTGLVFGGIVGIPAMFLVGMPAHLLLRSLGLRSALPNLLAGGMLGVLIAKTAAASFFHSELSAVVTGAVGGVIAACVAWRFVSRDHANTNPASTAP